MGIAWLEFNASVSANFLQYSLFSESTAQPFTVVLDFNSPKVKNVELPPLVYAFHTVGKFI